MTKEQFIKDFQSKQQLKYNSGFQNWWVKFVFHYNDIDNIVSILDRGKLYSRNKAKELGLLKTDIANDDVISHTNIKVHDYARFYFGAKTPTLYNNEGLISKKDIKNNAHCPVPIFLLFDFVKVLSLEGVIFSNGNMGVRNPEIYKNIKELAQLEWHYIYHRETLYNIDNARHINYCRNAEVLVKNELNIYDYLKWICVRSSADKETLLYLVDINTKEKIKDKIKVFTSDGLFHNHRLYIDEVKLKKQHIVINFINTNNQEFTLSVIIKSLSTNQILKKSKILKLTISKINIRLDGLDASQGIHFIFKIDDNRVYDNILFDENEILI